MFGARSAWRAAHLSGGVEAEAEAEAELTSASGQVSQVGSPGLNLAE